MLLTLIGKKQVLTSFLQMVLVPYGIFILQIDE